MASDPRTVTLEWRGATYFVDGRVEGGVFQDRNLAWVAWVYVEGGKIKQTPTADRAYAMRAVEEAVMRALGAER